MTALIAVDGHSLNLGLQKVAQNRAKKGNVQRFRIDHDRLAQFLTEKCAALEKQRLLRFYTDNELVAEEETDSRLMGRISKYFSQKGYGFISATDGNSYFFHNNEVINKRALCNSNENRYPHPTSRDFQSRILNKVVTFNQVTAEDGRLKAEEIKLEFGARVLDRFYRLRREPFLEMLEETGYQIVRCRPSRSSGKAKSIDCRIILDSLCDLSDGDEFVLLSDDSVFCELLDKLVSFDVGVTVVSFDSSRLTELRTTLEKNGSKLVLLDDFLDELELAYDENFDDFDDEDKLDDNELDEEDQGDDFSEEVTLASQR